MITEFRRANMSADWKYHYLYKITHKASGRIYIGIHSTNNLNDRYFAFGTYVAKDRTKSDWVKSNHGRNMKNSRLYNTMQKYGVDAFEREIIESFKTREQALKREEEIVTEEFINSDNNFNNRVGGMQGQFSKEIREKISRNNSMYRQDIRKKVAQKGKERWTDEMKDELSRNNPMYDREKYEKHLGKNSSWFGRKHTEETKKKISETKKTQKLTKEQKERNRISLKKVGSEKFEILDTLKNNKFTSLTNLRTYLFSNENTKVHISTLSEIINKKLKRKSHNLYGRFIYTKNSYQNKNPARLFKRGDYWQMRIWVNEEKRHFKKSLGTKSEEEAKKLAKKEEAKFYNNLSILNK